MPAASFAIITYNRAASLERALRKLAQQKVEGGFEIVVADNGSTDGTAEVAARFGARYGLCTGGIAEVRARAAEMSRGEFVVFTDDDCVAADDQVASRIVARFRGNGRIGIVGCAIENVGVEGAARLKGYTRFGANGSLRFVEDPRRADVVADMALSVRRDAYERVGGFDPAYSCGMACVDLSCKIRAAGWLFAHEPAARFVHLNEPSLFRSSPLFNRDALRLYTFFKFFPPRGAAAWASFAREEARLFRRDCAGIVERYRREAVRTEHSARVNRLLEARPGLVPWLRWPLAIGAIAASPAARRALIPLLALRAARRARLERERFGLDYRLVDWAASRWLPAD